MILGRICFRKVVVHAVAVQVPPPLTQIIRPQLYPGGAGIHIAEIAEALVVQIGKFLVSPGIGPPVAHVCAEGVEDDIGGADERFHPLLPFIGVCLYRSQIPGAQVDMAPAVGGQLPAAVPEALGHLADRFQVFLIIGIGVLIFRIGAVAQNTLVAGEGQDCPGSLIGKVRVLCNEILQQRHQVEGAGDHGPVVQFHFTGGLSIVPDDDPGGKAVALHIVIIADVVLGHDEGLLSRRQHDIAGHKFWISVFICGLIGDIPHPYQHIAPFIHLIQDL